jgi:hypothetical protein
MKLMTVIVNSKARINHRRLFTTTVVCSAGSRKTTGDVTLALPDGDRPELIPYKFFGTMFSCGHRIVVFYR